MNRLRNTLVWLALLLALPSLQAASAPDFTLSDLEGRQHTLSDYRGKWVVVNYWATWCPPCLEEIPQLSFFHEQHKDKDAVVLGISMEEITPQRLGRFVDEQMINYPVLMFREDLTLVGPVPGLPTTYLIDPTGRVVARRVGGVDADAIEAVITNYSHQVRAE